MSQQDHQTYSQDKIMAVTWNTGNSIESKPKKTRQGKGKHSKYSATASNAKRKPYRGQGK